MVSNVDAGIAFGEAVQKFKDSLTDSEAEIDGIAPPSADEWPELDLPEKPTPPPLEWKTPLMLYTGITAMSYLLIIGLAPRLSLIEDLTDFFQNVRTTAIPSEVKSAPGTSSAELSSATESQLPLTAAEIAEIQRLLKTAGFDPGPADGKAGARTRKALSNWASKRGLVIAELDRGTLELMRHGDAVKRAK